MVTRCESTGALGIIIVQIEVLLRQFHNLILINVVQLRLAVELEIDN